MLNVSNSEAGQSSTDKKYDPTVEAGDTPDSDAPGRKPASEKQMAANQRNSLECEVASALTT